jgi:hypothetical protein
MKTTTLSALFIASLSAFTFTSALASAKDTDQRGEMVVKGESVKAFAAGPATVRLYSMDHGGTFFTAPATTGTDADCAQAQKTAQGQQPVQVDRRNVLEVATGDVACLVTSTNRSFELLWHARATTAPANQTFVAQAR